METPKTLYENPPWDPERQLAYQSESESSLLGQYDVLFPDRETARAYLRQLQKREWYRTLFPAVKYVGLRKARYRTWAFWSRGLPNGRYVVDCPPQYNLWRQIVLHELAHCVNRDIGIHDAHGPGFRRILVMIIEHAVSPTAARQLEQTYRAKGLRLFPRTKILRASGGVDIRRRS